MRGKKIVFLIIELMLVLVFSGAIFFYTQSAIAPTKVLVANHTIAPNQTVSMNDFTIVSIPKAAVQEDFILNSKDFENKISAAKIFAGQYAVKSMLTDNTNKDVFADLNYDNYVKISMGVDYEDAFGGQIKRGDTVNVISVTEIKDPLGNKAFEAKTFIENAIVYSVSTSEGGVFESKMTEEAIQEGKSKDVANYGDIGVATLLVTKSQAEEIAVKQKSSTVKIVGTFAPNHFE